MNTLQNVTGRARIQISKVTLENSVPCSNLMMFLTLKFEPKLNDVFNAVFNAFNALMLSLPSFRCLSIVSKQYSLFFLEPVYSTSLFELLIFMSLCEDSRGLQ